MRGFTKVLGTAILLLLIIGKINTQTYFSKAYDIDTCYNEGTVIGLIEEGVLHVNGAMFCGVFEYHGSSGFSISAFDGEMLSAYEEDRFNIVGRTSTILESEYLISGTASFVPEKGIWKVDKDGNVLDSFLYNHPDEFVYTRGVASYADGYVATLVHEGASKFDLIQLDSNLDLTAYYTEYVSSDPGDVPDHHWEGPDGELYFTICRDSGAGSSCRNLAVLRFSPDGEHELIYKLPLEEENFGGAFNRAALPADDSSFYYLWHRDTFYYDAELDRYFADPSIVSKVTYSGERLWDAYFWEFNGRAEESFTTANGDLVVLGELFYHYPHQAGTYPEATMVAGGYAARISSQGEVLWERKILDPIHCKNNPGQQCYSTFYNGAELPNGDLLFTGRIDTIILGLPTHLNQNTNTWVVKTDANGCLRPDCGLLEILDTTFYTSTRDWVPQRRAVARLSISPNPVGGLGQVRINLPVGVDLANNGRLRLVDQLGRVIEVRSGVRLPYELSTGALDPGYYTLQWLDEREGKVWTGRLVVLR